MTIRLQNFFRTRSSGEHFALNTPAPLMRRVLILAFSILVWWVSSGILRIAAGPFISELRKQFGESHSVFWSHLFSPALPVFLMSLVFLLIFIRSNLLPRPRFFGEFWPVAREGIVWGFAACVLVIPLALSMGYRLGFQPDLQKYFGNVISNSYEELVYRVFLFLVAVYALRNIPLAIFLTSVLFALAHDQYPLPIQISIGLAGAFFSLAYVRSNAVIAAIVAHQLSDIILDTILVH